MKLSDYNIPVPWWLNMKYITRVHIQLKNIYWCLDAKSNITFEIFIPNDNFLHQASFLL